MPVTDSADPEVLWQALNDDERQRFAAILRDADGVVARQLLAEENKALPWWIDPEDDDASRGHHRSRQDGTTR